MHIPTPGLEQALLKWWSRWVVRGRKASSEYLLDGGQLLRYTARYRVTAAVAFAVFTSAYAFASRDERLFAGDIFKTAVLIGGSVLIWLLFASIFVTSLIERVVITPTHLRRRSWRGRQEILWGEVSDVRIDEVKADVKVVARGGVVIEVSLYLDGLPALADALQQHQRLPPRFRTVVLSDRAAPLA